MWPSETIYKQSIRSLTEAVQMLDAEATSSIFQICGGDCLLRNIENASKKVTSPIVPLESGWVNVVEKIPGVCFDCSVEHGGLQRDRCWHEARQSDAEVGGGELGGLFGLFD